MRCPSTQVLGYYHSSALRTGAETALFVQSGLGQRSSAENINPEYMKIRLRPASYFADGKVLKPSGRKERP